MIKPMVNKKYKSKIPAITNRQSVCFSVKGYFISKLYTTLDKMANIIYTLLYRNRKGLTNECNELKIPLGRIEAGNCLTPSLQRLVSILPNFFVFKQGRFR